MTTTGEEHYLRSSLLLLKGGTFITRKVVIREEQKEIRNSGRDLDDLLTEKKGKLEHEFRNHKHREKLFPANGKTEVEKWDISLLTGVLQVVFRSSLSENERKAVRSIKLQRNDVYAHRATADLSFDDYSDICVELKEALRNLAAEFAQEVKTECEDIIDSCLNGPIDIKSHIEHLKCVADTDKMFSAILEKIDANGKQTMENIKEVVEQEHVCLKKDIAEDISNSQEAVCKTIRETQLTKADLTALVIDAVQQALQEQRSTRKVKVVDSELEVSGKDVDEPNIDLAEQMIKTVTNEAIRRTQTSEEFKDIRDAIQEILDEIASRTGVKALEADIACVVISFSYETYEQLLKLLVYLDSEDIKLRLAKLATLLSHRLKTKEQLHLSTSLSVKCLQNILKELETDSQSEYKRKIHIPIQFDSVEGMAHVWNYFENGGATNSLNKLSEALSAKLGTKIKLTSSLNVEQFRSALDEFGSENTSLQLTDQSQVQDDTLKVHDEGNQISETSDGILKDPKSDESQEFAGGIVSELDFTAIGHKKAMYRRAGAIDLNVPFFRLSARQFYELQTILDSNPDNTNWRALAKVVQKKYNIRQHMIDGITYSGGSASSALLKELGAQGMTVKELQDYLNEIGVKFALVPISREVNVPFDFPFDFHPYIIGQKGRNVRKLMDEYNVNISIPPQDQLSDLIKVTGSPVNVQRAEDALAEKVKTVKLEKEDRLLKSHELHVEVDPSYHPKLIGRRGEVLRADHDVKIQLPVSSNKNQSLITIIGYENNCEEARDEILRMVKDYEDMVHIEVEVDHRIHHRIIGQKGRCVRNIQEDFKVDLRFPRGNDNPDIIVISGAEDDVYDCKDHLSHIEEEFLQDVVDNEYIQSLTQAPSRKSDEPKVNDRGFVIKNAPGDSAPDTSSTAEFPSSPGASGGNAVSPNSNKAWGPGRRY